MLKPFLNDGNPPKLCPKYFLPKLIKYFWIYLHGWSGNSGIWCVEQSGRAEKKNEKIFFLPGQPFLVQISQIFSSPFSSVDIFWNIWSLAFAFLMRHSTRPQTSIAHIVLKLKLEMIMAIMKVKLNPIIHPNILSEIMRLLGAVVRIWFKSLIDTFPDIVSWSYRGNKISRFLWNILSAL